MKETCGRALGHGQETGPNMSEDRPERFAIDH